MGLISGTSLNSLSHTIDVLQCHGLSCSVTCSWSHGPDRSPNIPTMGSIIFIKFSWSDSVRNLGISSLSTEIILIRFLYKSKIWSLGNRMLCRYLKDVMRLCDKMMLINVSAMRLTSGTAFNPLSSSDRSSSVGKSTENVVEYISEWVLFFIVMSRNTKEFRMWCSHDNEGVECRLHVEREKCVTRWRPWNASGWIYARGWSKISISWKSYDSVYLFTT